MPKQDFTAEEQLARRKRLLQDEERREQKSFTSEDSPADIQRAQTEMINDQPQRIQADEQRPLPGQQDQGQTPMSRAEMTQNMGLLRTFGETIANMGANVNMPNTDTPQMGGFSISKEDAKKLLERGMELFIRYKNGRGNLDGKIMDNERWWQRRNWNWRHDNPDSPVTPRSAWLFNCLANKHADAMESFPMANILPREESDEEETKRLSSIIPVILSRNDFEGTYSDVWWYKLINGTGVYGVFWDAKKNNGLGDISIKRMDLLNIFWQPAVEDIQDSPSLFYVTLMNNDAIESAYPQLKGKLNSSSQTYINVYSGTPDGERMETENMTAVFDWYYKVTAPNGRTVLHYCKWCEDEVLYASEYDPQYAERGFYDHGKYPFIFDTCYPTAGTPVGYGYVDLCKGTQEQIDILDKAILDNAVVNATPRYMASQSSGMDEQEFLDLHRPIVHVNSLRDDNVQPIQSTQMSGTFLDTMSTKVAEMKEITGNRDVSTGGISGGVTSASGIAALQEASSKLSKDQIRASYRAFKELVTIVVELVRQFYDLPRQFRIVGERGEAEYVEFTNAQIRPQAYEDVTGMVGYRIPEFDIDIVPQKATAYTKLSQNELSLQFFQLGFFNPELGDQALACLRMMDFDGKDKVIQMVGRNQQLLQQNIMLQQMVLQLMSQVNPMMAEQMAGSILGGNGSSMMTGDATGGAVFNNNDGLAQAEGSHERKNVADARARANSVLDL